MFSKLPVLKHGIQEVAAWEPKKNLQFFLSKILDHKLNLKVYLFSFKEKFFSTLIKLIKFNKIFLLTFYALFVSLIIEFFPFRSQGSFFSVWNASYTFFLLGIFCGLYDLKPKKSIKKIFNF